MFLSNWIGISSCDSDSTFQTWIWPSSLTLPSFPCEEKCKGYDEQCNWNGNCSRDNWMGISYITRLITELPVSSLKWRFSWTPRSNIILFDTMIVCFVLVDKGKFTITRCTAINLFLLFARFITIFPIPFHTLQSYFFILNPTLVIFIRYYSPIQPWLV